MNSNGSGSNEPSMKSASQVSAIVTGAASGIGRAVARELLKRGSGVCLVDLAPMQSAMDEFAEIGGSVVHVQGDIAERATMQTAVEAALTLGPLHTAVLNAGVLTGESDITRVSETRYNQVIGANVTGVVNGLAAFIEAVGPHAGRVVVTSSSTGLVPAPHDPVYAMTKHAVIGLVRSLALNPTYSNIRFNCICPNGVDTPMLSESLKAGRRLLSPDDIAARILEILDTQFSGQAWVCTPTTFKRFEFPPNPGYNFPSLEAMEGTGEVSSPAG
jgi:NAD(P)-dependent dehydrogenase (short-subunit alcohol dehydrogenase family)